MTKHHDKPNQCATLVKGIQCSAYGCRGTCKQCGAYVCSDHNAHGRCLGCRTTFLPSPDMDTYYLPRSDGLDYQVSAYVSGLRPAPTSDTFCPMCKDTPCKTETACRRRLFALSQHGNRQRVL